MAKSPRTVRDLSASAAAMTDEHNARARPETAKKTFADMTKTEREELLRLAAIRLGLITE